MWKSRQTEQTKRQYGRQLTLLRTNSCSGRENSSPGVQLFEFTPYCSHLHGWEVVNTECGSNQTGGVTVSSQWEDV